MPLFKIELIFALPSWNRTHRSVQSRLDDAIFDVQTANHDLSRRTRQVTGIREYIDALHKDEHYVRRSVIPYSMFGLFQFSWCYLFVPFPGNCFNCAGENCGHRDCTPGCRFKKTSVLVNGVVKAYNERVLPFQHFMPNTFTMFDFFFFAHSSGLWSTLRLGTKSTWSYWCMYWMSLEYHCQISTGAYPGTSGLTLTHRRTEPSAGAQLCLSSLNLKFAFIV